MDPYINVDPGALSPYQHGEVYGAETDEIAELHDHPWYFGVQFHPELKSRVLAGHPLFREFVKAAIHYKRNKQQA